MPNPTRAASQSWLRLLLHATAFVFIASMAAGCGIFSPDDSGGGGGGGTDPVAYPIATSENQLITNFVQAHRDRNFNEYDNLLAENFQFWFAPEDVNLAPNGFFWDRASDVASTERMFNGSVGQRPDGTEQPAVQNITITLTPAEPSWSNAGGETVGGVTQLPAEAKRRRYTVSMTVSYTAGDIVSQVDGEQLFYVLPVQRVIDGTTITEWKLLIWRDFGGTAAG